MGTGTGGARGPAQQPGPPRGVSGGDTNATARECPAGRRDFVLPRREGRAGCHPTGGRLWSRGDLTLRRVRCQRRVQPPTGADTRDTPRRGGGGVRQRGPGAGAGRPGAAGTRLPGAGVAGAGPGCGVLPALPAGRRAPSVTAREGGGRWSSCSRKALPASLPANPACNLPASLPETPTCNPARRLAPAAAGRSEGRGTGLFPHPAGRSGGDVPLLPGCCRAPQNPREGGNGEHSGPTASSSLHREPSMERSGYGSGGTPAPGPARPFPAVQEGSSQTYMSVSTTLPPAPPRKQRFDLSQAASQTHVDRKCVQAREMLFICIKLRSDSVGLICGSSVSGCEWCRGHCQCRQGATEGPCRAGAIVRALRTTSFPNPPQCCPWSCGGSWGGGQSASLESTSARVPAAPRCVGG